MEPSDPKDVVVVRLQRPDVGVGVEDLVVRPNALEGPQPLVDLPLRGGGIVAIYGFPPVEIAPVKVPGVVRLQGVIMVGPVVGLSQFIARVQHRDAALGQQEGVEGLDGAHHVGDPRFFAAFQGRLEAEEGSGGATEACIAQFGVVVVELASCVAPGPDAPEVVVEVLLVRHFGHAELPEEVEVEAPADVIVAPEVV